MDKFTKLSINGEERFVSAIYDGSGNEIETTYETVSNVSSKEQALSGRIDTLSGGLDSLGNRVTNTEAFDTRISKNAEDIATNSAAISALQGVDVSYRTELDSLTIKVGEATTAANNATNSLAGLSLSLMNNGNRISALEASVNDDAQGIQALNTQADKNTADIAKVAGDLTAVQTALDGKVSTALFTPVSTQVDTNKQDIANINGSLANKVESSVFNPVSQQVADNKSNIETLQGVVSNKAETSALTALSEQIADLLGRIQALEALVKSDTENPDELPEEPVEPEVTPDAEPEPEPDPEIHDAGQEGE